MSLKQLFKRIFAQRIYIPPKMAEDLKELSEEAGLPLEKVRDRVIHDGLKEWLKNREARKLLRTLTPRVREAAVLYCQGFSANEIGEKLSISPETVKNHLRFAVVTLGLRKRVELREALEVVVGEPKTEDEKGNGFANSDTLTL